MIDWHRYFISIAYLVSMKSKDPSTKIGAVVVGDSNEIISTGYNGYPRNTTDSAEHYNDKNYKYNVISHAEENAILHCARMGVSTKNGRMYVPWMPCSKCASQIIQSGITEVIIHKEFPGNKDKESSLKYMVNVSENLFKESKVKLSIYSCKLLPIKPLYKAKHYEL